MQHSIEGPWEPADQSKHTLEVARTQDMAPTGEPIVAIRDTFDPDRTVFATGTQVRNLVTAYEDGRLARLLGSNR